MTEKKIIIDYTPNSEHQRQFHASNAYEKALIAGFGSGKTLAGAAEFIKMCAINSGCMSMIVSPSYPMAKKTVIPTLTDLIEKSEIKYDFNKSEHTFFLPEFSQRIFIGSAEIPNSLKGANLSHVWTDELSIFPEDAYRQAIARVRDPAARTLALFHTMTPEIMTWVYDEFVLNARNNRQIIFGKTADNPAIGADYVTNLLSRYSPEMAKMYLEGKFIFANDRRIVPEWTDDCVGNLERSDVYKFYQHYVSIDWGVRDKTAIVWGTWFFLENKLQIEREKTLTNQDVTTENIANIVRTESVRLWGNDAKIRYVGDSNNLQVIQDMNQTYNLPFKSVTKSNLSDDPQRISIKQSMVNRLRVNVNAGQLIVSPECAETIGNFRSGIWNDKYTDFERTEKFGHFDLLSAIIYLDTFIDKKTNPIPPAYGTHRDSHYVPEFSTGRDNPFVKAVSFK